MPHNHICLILILFSSLITAQDQNFNMTLLGEYNRGDERYSGSWAYVAPDGTEYAILGAKTGTAVYPIDDPEDIIELDFIPGPHTNWREITVLGHHAYVVTDIQDSIHSMQVIDLSFLPDSIHLVTSYDATFNMGHIIQRDIYSDAPFVYVHGTNTTQGTHIIDVSDPSNPQEIGSYIPGYYIHDGHVKGNRLYAAAFFKDQIDVVDISNKANPTLITTIPDPGQNTHSSWLTEDNNYLFLASELDGLKAQIIDITDPFDPVYVSTYTANIKSLVHNPYILGDNAFCSHNTEGLRVVDIADPSYPIEIAYYDTFNGESGGFHGLWSACPYFPSGKIIGGDRDRGLMVFTHDGPQAVRIKLQVLDQNTNLPLVDVQIMFQDTTGTTNADGVFYYGNLPDTYPFTINHLNYQSVNDQLVLNQNQSDTLKIYLQNASNTFHPNLKNYDYTLQTNLVKNQLLHIQSSKVNNNVIFKIYNAQGQIITQYWFEKIEKTQVLNLPQLPKGHYYLQISDTTKSNSLPFVIIH